MSIFSEKKNLFFEITHRQINHQTNNKKTFQKAFNESGFTEYNSDFAKGVLGESNRFGDIKLFDLEGDIITPQIKSNAPFLLSTAEKKWLTELPNNPIIQRLEGDATIQKIIKAMRENMVIICDNETQYGATFENNKVLPCKLEYSIKMDMFWLIGYLLCKKKMVKMAVDRMTIHSLTPNKTAVDISAECEKQWNDEPIVLEIKEERGALERALHQFSIFKKDGYYDKERDLHIIKIFYYSFDEHHIIRDIISVGANAKVISPTAVAEKIKQKILKQKSMFA